MNQLETLKANGNLLRAARPKKSPSPKGRIKHASSKRAKQLAFYRVLRVGHLKQHPICEAGKRTLWHGCEIKSVEVHHVFGRVGDLLNDTRHFLAVCRPCHDRIHAHPSQARQLGLLK